MTIGSFTNGLYLWPDGRYKSIAPPEGLFSISSPFVDGQEVMVLSSELDFGDREEQTPLMWDNFKNGVDGQLLNEYDPWWVPYASHDGALIGSSNARYSGSKHALNTSARHEFDTNYKTFTPSKTRFLSYYYRTVDVVLNSSQEGILKHCRLGSSTAIEGGGGVYNGPGVHALSSAQPQSSSDPYVFFTNSANVIQDSELGPGGGGNEYIHVPWNQWTRIDMWLEMSDVNVPNGRFGCHVLGGEFWERTDLMQNVSGFPELTTDSIILGLMQANAVGSYSQQITDVYLDNNRGRFEVINAPTYAAATLWEIQPYTMWQRNRVKLRANIGAIPGPKWLVYIAPDHIVSDGFYIGG